mgnify:CR=1 FL=1
MFKSTLSLILLVTNLSVANAALAAVTSYSLVVKAGHFEPETIKVPANTEFKLVVTNQGPGAEEFESKQLRKETIIAEGATRTLTIKPLKPGTYKFVGEFHEDTARGQIIAE